MSDRGIHAGCAHDNLSRQFHREGKHLLAGLLQHLLARLRQFADQRAYRLAQLRNIRLLNGRRLIACLAQALVVAVVLPTRKTLGVCLSAG